MFDRQTCRAVVFAMASATMVALAPISPSMAQGWALSTTVSTATEFDDNPLLRPDGGDEAFSASVSPELTLSRGFQTGAFKLGLGLTAEKFWGDGVEGPGGQDLDSLDYRANMDFKSTGQRVDFNVGASFLDQTARTTELTDTGILDAEARKRTISGHGGLNFTLSERNFLDVGADASDVNYDSGLFTDHRSFGGSLGFRRSITAADDVGISFGYSRFDPRSGTGTESDRYSVSLTWSHEPSEAFKLSASAGARLVESRPSTGAAGNDETNIGGTFSLDLMWTPTLRDSLSLNASNSIQPSGSGSVQNRWVVGGAYGRDLTSEIRINLPASFQFQESVSDPTTKDRIYFDVGPNLAWMFLPNWRLTATYRFRAQDNAGGGSFARSNAIILRVAYQNSML